MFVTWTSLTHSDQHFLPCGVSPQTETLAHEQGVHETHQSGKHKGKREPGEAVGTKAVSGTS